MKIIILGDTHGHLSTLHWVLSQAVERFGVEAGIQVGDFGFSEPVLHRFIHHGPGKFPVPLHVIDGNHEDHEWMFSADRLSWDSRRIYFHCRGSVADIGGAHIGFVGGALHADRRQEHNWWPAGGRPPPNPLWSNWVSAADVQRSLRAIDGVDLLVTHSCPMSIGVGMRGHPSLVDYVAKYVDRAGFRSGPIGDCGEPGLTDLWNQMPIRPPQWVFGHFHQLRQSVVGATQFTCVGSIDASDGRDFVNPVIYDTVAKTVTVDMDPDHAIQKARCLP